MTDDHAPPPTIPPFSDEYHRARRNLTLTSALLLGLEFVGITIEKKASVGGVPLKINNPDTISIVLFLLVLFFGARYVIEWLQSDQSRRKSKASRCDLYLAIALAVSSCLLFAVQKISGLNVGGAVQEGTETFTIASIIIGLFLILFVSFAVIKNIILDLYSIVMIFIILITSAIMGFKYQGLSNYYIAIIIINTIATILVMINIYRRYNK